MSVARFQIEWSAAGETVAIEPRPDEIARHAPFLAAAYNDPRNAQLLGHAEPLSESDVVDHYATLRATGARAFLLFADGAIAGDGDLRAIADGDAEIALLVASPSAQGKGLGTRFATMLHAFAFDGLGLERIYASIVPANVASRRVFEKLGHAVDERAVARRWAEDDRDLVMSIDRAAFGRVNAAAIAQIRITGRFP